MSKPLIALYPGHYHRAPGARNNTLGLIEYSCNVKTVDALVEYLESNDLSYEVVTGKNMTLREKVNRINSNPEIRSAFDLHYNASGSSRASGCEVLYYPHAGVERKKQAALISSIIARRLHVRDRGAKKGWYWGSSVVDGRPTKVDFFLKSTRCPAFILEPGFIDNYFFASEYLNKPEGIKKIAEAVALAIDEYCKRYILDE